MSCSWSAGRSRTRTPNVSSSWAWRRYSGRARRRARSSTTSRNVRERLAVADLVDHLANHLDRSDVQQVAELDHLGLLGQAFAEIRMLRGDHDHVVASHRLAVARVDHVDAWEVRLRERLLDRLGL